MCSGARRGKSGIYIPDQPLNIGLVLKPWWPYLRNGSKKESVKRKSTELGVRGLGADAGSAVQVIVPDTTYPPGLSVVVSNAEMMILTLST